MFLYSSILYFMLHFHLDGLLLRINNDYTLFVFLIRGSLNNVLFIRSTRYTTAKVNEEQIKKKGKKKQKRRLNPLKGIETRECEP